MPRRTIAGTGGTVPKLGRRPVTDRSDGRTYKDTLERFAAEFPDAHLMHVAESVTTPGSDMRTEYRMYSIRGVLVVLYINFEPMHVRERYTKNQTLVSWDIFVPASNSNRTDMTFFMTREHIKTLRGEANA